MKSKLIFGIGLVVLGLTFMAVHCSRQKDSEIDKIMKADVSFKFPPGFPPDPGAAGKKALQGIDSDHDGLRDDIQRWIYARFPNEKEKQSALKQMALAYQKALGAHSDKDMIINLERTSKAIRCLDDIFGNQNNEMELVQAKVLNTKKRVQRFLEVSRWYDGKMLGENYPSDGTACEN